MAIREKSRNDLEFERIKADKEKTLAICNLIKWCFLSTCATVSFGILMWGIVNVTQKSDLVQIVAMIFALLSPPSFGIWRLVVSMRKKSLESLSAELESAPAPSEEANDAR